MALPKYLFEQMTNSILDSCLDQASFISVQEHAHLMSLGVSDPLAHFA